MRIRRVRPAAFGTIASSLDQLEAATLRLIIQMQQPPAAIFLPVRKWVIAAILPGRILIHHVSLQSALCALLKSYVRVLIPWHLQVLICSEHPLDALLLLCRHLIVADLSRESGMGSRDVHLSFT